MEKANKNILPVPTETDEQKSLFKWIAYASAKNPELMLFSHTPNEGKRSVWNGAQLKQMGLRSGVPDLHLPVARGGYHSLYIELKRTKGGRVSDKQKWWIERLNEQGNLACVCCGWVEAKSVICRYLGIKDER